MKKLLIKNGKVWNGDRFYNADVLVEHGKISAIDDNINEDAHFVFDAKDKIVSPGLVDAHMHMRGVSADVFGVPAESACFPFGVTAAADASGVHGDKQLLDSFMVKNRVFVCSAINDNIANLTNAQEMIKKYKDKVVGVKAYFDTSVQEVHDTSPLREICDFARDNGIVVMVHCSNSPAAIYEITNVLSKGDILTHAYQGSSNNISCDEFRGAMNAKKCGVIIDAGLAGNVHVNFKIFEHGIKQGLTPDIISTDLTKLSVYTRGGRYGMTMCMSIAKNLGMSEEEIFRAVTSNPAKALGMEKQWGYLKIGRCSDIAVIEYSDEGFDLTDRAGNRVHSDMGYRCVLTVSDGQVVYRR